MQKKRTTLKLLCTISIKIHIAKTLYSMQGTRTSPSQVPRNQLNYFLDEVRTEAE